MSAAPLGAVNCSKSEKHLLFEPGLDSTACTGVRKFVHPTSRTDMARHLRGQSRWSNRRYHRRMTMTSEGASRPEVPSGTAGLEVAAALFHGLSDPSRLAILQHLSLGEHRVRDLTDHLPLAQSTVSAHLVCLRDCGLVKSRPQGRASLFSLTSAPELLGLLDAAQRLLATSGYAVALCPNYGLGTEGNPRADQLRTHGREAGG